MHETMVAQGIFDTILAEAKKQNAKPISANLSCGLLNAVNDEVLTFAFDAIAKGTICQDTKLEIEHKPMRGKCDNCGESFDIELTSPRCPDCNSDKFKLLPDPPLLLEAIEFETE
ncbi:hydrogenase maturation nickel metallochaperone HypA [Planctomycetota bacterium]